jgi:hypothetical protein
MIAENNESRLPLDCAEFLEILPDLDRVESPAFRRREAALAHAESCSGCAALLTESESLDFGLRTLARRDALLQAPPRSESALIQFFRREREASARRSRQRLTSILAVAAIALLTIGIALRHRIVPIRGAIPSTEGVSTKPPAPADGSGGAPGAPQSSNSSAQFASAEQGSSLVSGTEYASAFIPVPYTGDSADLQNGTVVRVMLPRAVLASLGMSAAYSGSADRIPADVILSEDGTPQAIRLVSQAGAPESF